MLPPRVIYYGEDEPLPEQVSVRAGPLHLIWGQGDLRYIRWGSHEVLRRIYVAIRDQNWGTIANRLSNVQLDVQEDSFRINFDAENRAGNIHFAWQGSISGTADGTIICVMDGTALSTFWKNRIGFCVLHPASAAGARTRLTRVDGTVTEAELPCAITPSQPVEPFYDMGTLAHEVAPGKWAEVRFEGDLFEMEDQRNWTDASFKTFSTPIRLPYPVEVPAGTRIRQSVTLTIEPRPGAAREHAVALEQPAGQVTLEVGASVAGIGLPKLGLGCASHGARLTEREVARLKRLGLDHLRVDLPLADPGYQVRLRTAAADAARLDLPLHVAILAPVEQGDAPLAALRELLDEIRPRVGAWLVYPVHEIFTGGSPVAETVDLARRHVTGYAPGAPLGSGSNADHIFLARSLPPLHAVDFLTFAITPQVHAFDNASLVETLATQAAVVASARRLGRGLPVAVGPVTLRQRHNPTATGPVSPVARGELPPQVDPRQMSLFAAGWTAGSLKYLAQAGAASVTYYETTGWRGVMETETGSPLPERFRSFPRGVFPLYHVFADVAEFGGNALPLTSTAPLVVEGLALRRDERLRVVAANLSDKTTRIRLKEITGPCSVRYLDETTAEEAMRSPEPWRQSMDEAAAHDGALVLTLLPYAVATIDALKGS